VAEPNFSERCFKQLGNFCVSLPTRNPGEHGQAEPVEASDQQGAGGIDQLAGSHLAKAP
jgi:hypothetical protein